MFGRDPRTTKCGLLLIISSVCFLGMRTTQGMLSLADLPYLLLIVAGFGLLCAADSLSRSAHHHADEREVDDVYRDQHHHFTDTVQDTVRIEQEIKQRHQHS